MKGRKYSKWKRAGMILAAVVIVAVAGIFVYIEDYYHALPVMQETLSAAGEETAAEQAGKKWITYGDPECGRGLVFYPGAKVEEEAYGPLLREIAGQDFFCVLVRMPGRLAVLNSGAAAQVMEAYPDMEEWYLGGHSLGGAMAASFAASGQEEKMKGLVLLAAYAPKPLPKELAVLSIYGSRDGVLNREKYEEYRDNLPEGSVEYVIEGGNHAGFGWYGEQDGDREAGVTPPEQWKMTAEKMGSWADGMEG